MMQKTVSQTNRLAKTKSNWNQVVTTQQKHEQQLQITTNMYKKN